MLEAAGGTSSNAEVGCVRGPDNRLRHCHFPLHFVKTISQPSLLKAKQIAVDGDLVCFVISCLSKSREHGKQVSELLLQSIQFSIKVCQLVPEISIKTSNLAFK